MRVVVLGIGNVLLGDEAVGVRVIEALQDYALPPEVELVDGGTCGMELFDQLIDVDLLIVVDALLAGKKPGEIDRKSTRLNSSHSGESRMPSSA